MSSSDLKLFASLAELLTQQSGSGGWSKVTYCSATCLDQECRNKLFFPQHEASVECPNCGQRHSVAELPDRKVLDGDDQRYAVEVAQLRKLYAANKKTAEQVKVKGFSNFMCKLLSPLLSVYGMGKNDQPSTLEELGLGETFDCSKFGSRSFAIEEKYLHVLGYGLDRSGSQAYLQDTLEQLKEVNNGVQCLVPLHADGDGHCLVHAISRCVVGRELFWHALRSNLHGHLSNNLTRYKNLFKDFYSSEEWEGLVAEAGPDWKPPAGQTLGLCNIHVYGLANVLRRPIILLDNLTGMQSSGDYSGTFLPTMFTPKECSSKDGSGVFKLNSPIVIAWSNSGRNHFIPLVPIKGRPLPKLPPHLQPKVWGSEEELLDRYIKKDEDGSMKVCGGKELGERYLLRLVNCMEKVFMEKNKVIPSLVGEVDQYVFKVAGYVGMGSDVIISTTRAAIEEGRLFRCLICSTVSIVPADWLSKGGMLYKKAAESPVGLVDGVTLSFPFDGITACYNGAKDSLVLLEVSCFCCTSTTRNVSADGTLCYKNGDRTQTVSVKSRCGCGYMHYWDGAEYDNLPEKVPLSLSWGGRTISINVYWFQYESDPSRNSNVYQVANKAVNDHFPGEFGSERLVQQVVDHILKVTENKVGMEQVSGHHPPTQDTPSQPAPAPQSLPSQDSHSPAKTESDIVTPASKIILTGHKSRTLHKEELVMSETERSVQRKIEDNARVTQNKRKGSSSSKSLLSTPTSKIASAPAPSKTTPSPPTKSQTTEPLQKRLRVTSSDGRATNLSLDVAVTYAQLQEAIEKEFGVPSHRQKLRSGFPPRELRPPSDPTQPVDLANGDRVSLDIIPQQENPEQLPQDTAISAMSADSDASKTLGEAQQTLNTLLQHLLGKEVDLWSVAQHQPHLFRKGGDYYQQVVEKFGSQLKENTHIQFKELPNKTFAFNAATECLELCLGVQHVPVGPLSSQQEQLAVVASLSEGKDGQASHEPTTTTSSSKSGVKAFSGKGHTLSSGSSSLQSEGAGRNQPSAPKVEDDPLMNAARMVAQKRLIDLKQQETVLQQKVRALNRKYMDAEANEGGASAKDNLLSSIETQLVNTSSDLKNVRDEIKELTTL